MMKPASESDNRIVATWLLVCAALVFAMVVLGGVTRLTGSGLSMVNWRPVTGVLPPLSDAAWLENFNAYQASPEFEHVNSTFDLAAFKGIFWLEYLHRLLGRLIGLCFLLPMLFFFWRGMIAPRAWPKYLLMFVLGGAQGVLGWYMVKSGLVDNPQVSQYRLTAHLIAAFTIYAYLVWVALSLLYRASDGPRHPWYGKAIVLGSLITLTIISGGFVAGLKAGHAFNTFPLMAGSWIPPGMWTFQPGWLNFFENIVTVQFDHRVLALTTFAAVILMCAYGRRVGMPARAHVGLIALIICAGVQVALGISTLLLHVPVALAVAHQANALVLFTVILFIAHALRGNR